MAQRPNQTKLRFALAGSGAINRDFHLRALLEEPGVEVVAAANLHGESLKQLAQDFGIPRTHQDFESLARDPEVDAVVIGVPNYLNARLSIMMLEHGKHVLCEKPMATCVEDAEAMIRAADAARRKLMIAHVWRSDPDMQWLRGIVREGRLGQIHRAVIHAVSQGWGPPQGSWRTQRDLAGGGALTDVAVHGIDALHFLFDDTLRIARAFAVAQNNFRKMSVEDTACACLEYDTGLCAQIHAGWFSPFVSSPHGTIELFGSLGTARILPSECHVMENGQPVVHRPAEARQEHIGFPMYRAQMQNFIACIVNDSEPICSPRHAIEAIRVLEAAYESARAGEAVNVEAPVGMEN